MYVNLFKLLYYCELALKIPIGKVIKIVLYCIVLYCIVLYCIVLYCIVLYCIESEVVLKVRKIKLLQFQYCGRAPAKSSAKFGTRAILNRFVGQSNCCSSDVSNLKSPVIFMPLIYRHQQPFEVFVLLWSRPKTRC